MIKKIFAVLCSFMFIMLTACQYQTVEDMNQNKKAAEAAAPDGLSTNPADKPTQDPNIQYETSIHIDPTFAVTDKDRTIYVANLGDTIDYCDFEFTVEQVWESEDLMILDEIEGNSEFRDYLLYKNPQLLDEQGRFTGRWSESKWLFIKMKIKNNNATKALYITPDFYNASGIGEKMMFTRMATIESNAFDKYKYISDRTQFRTDGVRYYLHKGETLETVVTFMMSGMYSDLYLGTKFLFRSLDGKELGSTDPKDLPKESYMIRLNLVNKKE